MQNPLPYYLEKQSVLTTEIKALKRVRNYWAILKLLLFIVIIVAIIFLVDQVSAVSISGVLLSIIAFIASATVDEKTNSRFKLKKQLLKSVETEIDALNLDFKDLDQGLEFKDSKHFYSNDLDLFGNHSMFQFVNRTATTQGKHKLAQWLLGQAFSNKTITEKQQAHAELKDLADWRLDFNATGKLKEEDEKDSTLITLWLGGEILFKKKYTPFLYLGIALNFAVILCTILLDLNPNYPFYSAFILLFVVFRFVKKTNKTHQKLDFFTKSFSNFHKLLQLLDQQDFKAPYLKNIKDQLFNQEHSALKAFKEASKILNAFDQRSNILITIVLNGLYMRDLFLLKNIDAWREKYDQYLLNWVDLIAEVDALNSVANYHFNNPEFIYPSLSKDKILSAKDLGHPSIPREVRVCNHFELKNLHEIDIVTGANMAGKSTFLRTVGFNLILAKLGGPVCAKSFEFTPIVLFTSMRTTDDLADETSYFHAELLRLKQLVDLAKSQQNVFIILDEILKGTNSKDKLNGSQRFLTKLLELPISGLVATHDLELGKLANAFPNNFKNTCFEIEINGHDIHYDYKLKPGVSQNMNATLLMEGMALI